MFFSRRHDRRLMLLLEVQSSLVRGSLVLSGRDGAQPTILFSQSLDIAYKPNASSTYYVKSTLDDVELMVDSILRNLSLIAHGQAAPKDIPSRIDEVHFVLSSPWVISQAKTVTVSFERDTEVDAERIHKILEDERSVAGFDAKAQMETIEEKVFDVRLNGYSVANWKGKSARTLDVTYALSIGSNDSMKRLRDAVSKIASGKRVSFHSSLLLQYMSLRGAHIPADPCLLVHAHGELTDMVVVRRGTCSFFGSYPTGANTIIRKIAEATHTDKKTAGSLLSLYLGRHMDGPEEARAGIVIQSMMKGWMAELERLWQGSRGGAAPASIFVIAHSHEDLFEETLRSAYPCAKVGKLAVDMVSTYASAISVIS